MRSSRFLVLLGFVFVLIICAGFLMRVAGQAATPPAPAATAAAAATPAPAPEFGYLGTKACMPCHKSANVGDQYDKWVNSPHAKAYAALQSEEAAKIATQKGLKVPAYECPDCIRCHITGWNAKAELLGKDYVKTDGVSCESCHGPGAQYKTVHMRDKAKAMTLGMIEPNEALCRTCHNEQSPTYKPFDFAKFSAIIAHPRPPKKTSGQ